MSFRTLGSCLRVGFFNPKGKYVYFPLLREKENIHFMLKCEKT